ncbi:MAG: succinate dehydrogenase [Lachnospiraceae bacterium]|nr:succinate dehydrogenase [Lachnospiraceae bacterium]
MKKKKTQTDIPRKKEFIFRIRRQKSPDSDSYWEDFSYVYDRSRGRQNVAGALRELGAVRFECGCLQKKCGACAMVINHVPRLACDVWLEDISDLILLEPLKKFPVIEDLVVDRQVMFESLKKMELWLKEAAREADGEQFSLAYQSSRCLQCGCCLEICPNYYPEGDFFGMAGMVPSVRVMTAMPDAQKKAFYRQYRKHIYEGCGKSLSCRDICPAGIPMEELMVNASATAVWKRNKIKK